MTPIVPPLTLREQVATTARALGEVVLALSPWVPAPRPHAARSVTAEWLTNLFRERAPGAAVENIEPVWVHTGTTDRQRIRLSWNAAGRDAGLPGTLFIKSTPLSARNRTMVAALDMAVNEVKFYRSARKNLPDEVAPIAYAAHAGHGARHLLLLNDLSALGAKTYALAEDCSLEHAEGMMRTLAALHAAFWDSPRFATDLAYAVLQSRRPGFSLLMRTFRKVRRTFLESDKYVLSPAVRRMCELVNVNDRRLYARWEQGPLTLIHGDSHLGNSFSLPGGQAGLLDWQVIGRGPGLREVSYFLTDSTPIEIRRRHERDLLRLYLDALAEGGVRQRPSFDQAWSAYRYFAFDAWDSVAICDIWPGLQEPANVEAGLKRANAAIEDLEVDQVLRAALA